MQCYIVTRNPGAALTQVCGRRVYIMTSHASFFSLTTLSCIWARMTPWVSGEPQRPPRQIEAMSWWRAVTASTTIARGNQGECFRMPPPSTFSASSPPPASTSWALEAEVLPLHQRQRLPRSSKHSLLVTTASEPHSLLVVTQANDTACHEVDNQ